MNTRKTVFKAISKITKVGLSDDIQSLLGYVKGVEDFSTNIDISISEIENAQNSLFVDTEDLKEDLERVKQGLELAERMASDLGVDVSQVPNYDYSKEAVLIAEDKLNKAQNFL